MMWPNRSKKKEAIIVAAAYQVPKADFEKVNVANSPGTNKETKKVCPKLDEKVRSHPNNTDA